jgi:adenylate cyclase
MDNLKERQIADEIWRWYLTGEENEAAYRAMNGIKWLRRINSVFPGEVRCLQCDGPLRGPVSPLMRFLGTRPSSFNPNLCSRCENLVLKHEGGTEVELTMVFADVRGSTPLSLETSPKQFSQLIGRFYREATSVLIKHNAMVNRLMGDQVIGLFVPHIAGPDHANQAVLAGCEILSATMSRSASEPSLPLGIGIHLGTAYVGSVGSSDMVNEIAVLGDAANIAARLSSAAEAGELIISDAAAKHARLEDEDWEERQITLKGIPDSIAIRSNKKGKSGQ